MLAFLADAGGRLVGTSGLDATASLVVELAVPALADCAVLVLPDVRGRLEWWRWSHRGRCTRGRIRRPSGDLAPGLIAALDGLKLVAELSPAEVGALPRVLAEPLARYSAVSAVSLLATDAVAPPGALVLARRDAPDPGDEMTIAFTERAGRAVAAANRFERLTAAAEDLQSTLRPAALPVLPGIRMAAIYRPAASPVAVGGDFYDIHPQGDGTTLFTLGDVCGNGPEAAALSGRVRQALAALLMVENDPQRLLRLVNQALLGIGPSKFATVVVGSMHRRAGGALVLRLSSGGHPAPMVLRRNGIVDTIAVPGMLVGIMPKAEFGENTVELGPLDTCVLYTDGITEARGGDDGDELFGSDRLRVVLAGCAGLPVEMVAARVDQAVQRWSGGDSRDDIALLALQSVPGQ
ncbi:MAG TPA: PP2C family protein-serine/threonine phosphatase [Actinophytocola sp.]|uniref:PP2C family protein-serine/threonine phosphatase n=1 Tax=Actinophytocola sp. TaxID=1872138 RepID=UPI002DF7F23A|nr:PP2C family protein-serine/threonine phosphatase [Actinophytocola sp.]